MTLDEMTKLASIVEGMKVLIASQDELITALEKLAQGRLDIMNRQAYVINLLKQKVELLETGSIVVKH